MVIRAYVHVDVPWRIEHDGVALADDCEVELAQVAVDPLFRSVLDLVDKDIAHPGVFLFVVIDLVVDVLAVLHVATSVQVRAVAQRLVRVRIDDLLEVHVLALRSIWPSPHIRQACFF